MEKIIFPLVMRTLGIYSFNIIYIYTHMYIHVYISSSFLGSYSILRPISCHILVPKFITYLSYLYWFGREVLVIVPRFQNSLSVKFYNKFISIYKSFSMVHQFKNNLSCQIENSLLGIPNLNMGMGYVRWSRYIVI